MSNAKKYVFLIFTVFIIACSTQKHYKTLAFFFDGVPNPDEIEKQGFATDSIQQSSMDSTAILAEVKKPTLTFHQPFRNKECAACHNQGQMGSLKEPQPNLCYQCHTNFSTLYSFEHGPAAGGFCTECHQPHKAKDKNLLRETGQELCLRCHRPDEVYKSDFHDRSDKADCTTCHNPHGSKNHSLLQPGTCTQCHDDFNEQYAVVHGPVAGGYCSACHTSHRSGKEKLLIKTGQQLCYYCHETKQILKNEEHADIEDADCTECHNPHGGDDRYMFN